jgi:hypothetical protein
VDETLFYVFGIGLVASALVVSAIGLRVEGFPPTRAALAGVIVYFAAMVAATTTFAVLNARDAAHAREAKEASEASQAQQEGGGASTTTTTTTSAARSPATTPSSAASMDTRPPA